MHVSPHPHAVPQLQPPIMFKSMSMVIFKNRAESTLKDFVLFCVKCQGKLVLMVSLFGRLGWDGGVGTNLYWLSGWGFTNVPDNFRGHATSFAVDYFSFGKLKEADGWKRPHRCKVCKHSEVPHWTTCRGRTWSAVCFPSLARAMQLKVGVSELWSYRCMGYLVKIWSRARSRHST